ncbi:MAG TPA: NAD(P)-dependent oxidoreductase [Planctomycetota bacterium]|nr:NAD(P)-dependent oxidoreductase [Planctomycetota bacterium]
MAKIVVCDKLSRAWLDAFAAFLRERAPEGLPLDLVACDADPETRDEALAGAHVLVAGLVGQCCDIGREAIEKCPELRLVQKVGSRAAGVDLAAARDAGVQVSLLPAPAHVACAEHTMLLILALARKLVVAHQRVVRRPLKETGPRPRAATAGDYAYNWANLEGIGVVADRTLGLIGVGDIGIEVARRARGFGLKLIYHDSEALPAEEERELGLERRELDELLKEADIVSLHVGLSPETEKLINAERLALMKPSALLVNTARGGLVDEAALADALEQGRLAGAALDVWAVEPTPKDNPLLKLDSVVATPHIGAGTLSKTALFEAILPNILAALRGEKVAGSLTPEVEPKPALPIEAPPPAEDTGGTPVPPETPGSEAAGETPVPPSGKAEEKPAAEGEGEDAAADESLDGEDTPPTIAAGPTP